MPSDFPRRPKLQKGALAVYEPDKESTQPQVIVFQYNPDQVKRTLTNRTPQREPSDRGGAKEDVMRVAGPPVETISLTVALNAADQLAEPDQHQLVVKHGLHPALATLDMLLYPPALSVQKIEELAGRGEVQISTQSLSLTLLVWGESRVVPITLTNFSVTEKAFDQRLNPIQADVELAMRVLTYMELEKTSVGWEAYLSYQRQKENLSRQHLSGGGAGGGAGFGQKTVTRPGR